MKYLVVIEKGPHSYGAHVPDLPGCLAVGTSEGEVRELIREAIELHIEDLQQRGATIPQPTSFGDLVEIDAA